eukprot:7174876-Prymnesium_polylepis.1
MRSPASTPTAARPPPLRLYGPPTARRRRGRRGASARYAPSGGLQPTAARRAVRTAQVFARYSHTGVRAPSRPAGPTAGTARRHDATRADVETRARALEHR